MRFLCVMFVGLNARSDRQPDAVNLWIGNGRSVTSIHNGQCRQCQSLILYSDRTDPYENIYTVVRGAKHFTLLPPSEGWCLQGKVGSTCSHP